MKSIKPKLIIEANSENELMIGVADILVELCRQHICDDSCPMRNYDMCSAIQEYSYRDAIEVD